MEPLNPKGRTAIVERALLDGRCSFAMGMTVMIKSQITLKQLEAFAFVVDTGTFRAAAEALGTTQPNISARIAALETALDTTLLIRDSGTVQLTSKGRTLLDKARKVLWAGESLIDEAGRQDLITERLRLGVTELVACTWLRLFLRRLKDTYPNLRVELQVDLSTTIDQRLSEGQLDLALQSEPFKAGSFNSIPLGTEEYCWVARADLAKSIGINATIDQVFEQTILTHAKHTLAGSALHNYAAKRRLNAGQIVHSSALSACLPMVQEGMGVAMLPKALVKTGVEAGELRELHLDWLPPPLSFYGRYSAARTPLFVAKACEIAAQTMLDARVD